MRARGDVRWMLLALVLMPLAAAAQTSDPVQPRVTIGGGGGVAFPFHGDFDFTPWAWEADVRVGLSRHGALELGVGEWRHSDSRVVEDVPFGISTGVIGRLEQTTTRVQRMLQVNVLVRGATGRVGMTGGGGIGWLQHERRTRQVTDRCSAGIPCGPFESTFSNGSGAAQAVGGVDVRVSGGLSVYGQVRLVVPMADPAGSDLRLTTGVRWGFGRLMKEP